MKKSDIANVIRKTTNCTQADANEAANAIIESMIASLQLGESIFIDGLGTLKIKDVPAKKERIGRNPKTGESVKIASKPASKKIVFSVAGSLKKLIKG